jgi:DNA-binding NarL/FixJ family response regulator
MHDRDRKVLVIPGEQTRETELMRLLMPLLVGFGCSTARSTEGYGVTATLERTQFDLVVAGFPIEEPPLTALLKSMRWKQAACRRTPLLVVSTRDQMPLANEYLGRGVNRVISSDATDWEIDNALRELLAVEPRVRYSTLVKIELPHGRRTEYTMAQLDNLSTTGMLIRGHGEVEVGAPMPFEMPLSGDPTPIRGMAEVVRPTTREREGLVGFAARFVRIDGDGADRLERFVRQRMVEVDRGQV